MGATIEQKREEGIKLCAFFGRAGVALVDWDSACLDCDITEASLPFEELGIKGPTDGDGDLIGLHVFEGHAQWRSGTGDDWVDDMVEYVGTWRPATAEEFQAIQDGDELWPDGRRFVCDD